MVNSNTVVLGVGTTMTRYAVGLEADTMIGSNNGFTIVVVDWSVINIGEATMLPCAKIAIRLMRAP